jgi:hypothetical protein
MGHHQAVEVFTKSHKVYAYLPGSRSVSFIFKQKLRAFVHTPAKPELSQTPALDAM